MDARKHVLVALLGLVMFLATAHAGKYSLMTIIDKYGYNIAKFKTNYI
jgi:hypothetical protein